jgi:hypothetical protein
LRAADAAIRFMARSSRILLNRAGDYQHRLVAQT